MHDCAVRGGLQACVDYFIEHIGEVNGMSEHLSVVGLRADPFELTQTALDVIGLVNLGALQARWPPPLTSFKIKAPNRPVNISGFPTSPFLRVASN